MDLTIKTKWLAALRSDTYKQGMGMLRCKDSYCCLGVLADIVGAEWKRTHRDASGHPTGTYILLCPNSQVPLSGYLPVQMMHEVGLDDREMEELVTLNDAGHTFKQIADHIEATL